MVDMRGGLSVEEPSGERWELALELLEAGGEGVAIGNVALLRPTGSPVATGQVEVSIFTAWQPESLTTSMAREEIREGVERVRAFILSDHRLQDLFDRFGVAWDYRYDYGMGGVRLAALNDDGEPLWEPEFEPRS